MRRALITCALIITAATLALSSISASAGKTYYRWVDDRGDPVHSDRPPPKGIDYEVVSTGSTLIRPVESNMGVVPLETEPRAGNDFEQVDEEEAKIVKNPEYCQRARDNLETLGSSARIRLRDDEGQFRYINEEEKAIQRQQALDAIDVHCE